MIILSQTTDILEVVLGGAITTNQLKCLSSWRDITTSSFTPDRTVIVTNGATPVNAVGSPAASTQRVVDLLNVYNADTVAQTVTVQFNANGTRYVLISAALATGESLVYQEGIGWAHLNASGSPIVSTGITTVNGTAAEITATTAGGVVTLSLPAALTFTGKTVTGGTFSGPTLSGTMIGSGTIGGSIVINTSGSITGGAISGTTGTFSGNVALSGAANNHPLNVRAAAGYNLQVRSLVSSLTLQAANDADSASVAMQFLGSAFGFMGDGLTNWATITSTGLAVTGVVSTTDPAGGAGPNWKLGVAAVVSPTSPNRTVRIDIGGTSYYLAAKTTND